MVMTEDEKMNTAYHGSGHAVVAKAGFQIRSGSKGHHHSARSCPGLTIQLPEQDRCLRP